MGGRKLIPSLKQTRAATQKMVRPMSRYERALWSREGSRAGIRLQSKFARAGETCDPASVIGRLRKKLRSHSPQKAKSSQSSRGGGSLFPETTKPVYRLCGLSFSLPQACAPKRVVG